MKRYYKSIKAIRDPEEYRKRAKELFALFDVTNAEGEEVPDKRITATEFTNKMAQLWHQDKAGTEKLIDENIADFERHRAAKKIQKIARGKAGRKKAQRKQINI